MPSSTSTTTAARTAALPHRATPATAYTARPKADPGNTVDTHNRVRTDRVDQFGKLTLRHAGRLHHIGIGRTHTGTRVLVLVQDLNIRIINAATGELIRQLTLDPTRDYQPRKHPNRTPKEKARTLNEGSELFRCLETSQWRWRRDLNPRTVLAVSRFQGECIRPLCHATADKGNAGQRR